MKRFIAVAALAAAAVVPATQAGAVPLGSQAACSVGNSPATPSSSCLFLDGGQTVGVGGVMGPGGSWSLTHKEKTSSCVNHVIVHTVSTVTDESGTGPNYIGAQPDTIAGVVYTITINGPGFASGGGPGTPGPDSAAEPADTPRDMTGGTVAEAACG